MVECATFLDGCHYFESAPTQDLFQGFDYAAGLVEQYIGGPECAGCRDENTSLAFVQADWHGHLVLAHHTIYDTVEHHFKGSGHIAPVAG